jgi:glyoxylase-like metal-dependent hydrolase (beta-lactamase superfamily II)
MLLDDADFVAYLNRVGYPSHLDQCLITALPEAGYDVGAYALKGATVTRIVDDGDIVDTGERRFEILHLPGHSPGSIGLWEAGTGTLFSGDCVYDGSLLDELGTSNIDDYVASMIRLRDLPVVTVHAGHDPSFGKERLHALIDKYLAARAG